jgi:glyoxylase-like metal-dependent hydrolase (beta-lactamase superfamily II)
VIPAPGHTPGHIAAAIRSGDATAIYVADTIMHAVEVEQPDRVSSMDTDPDLTRESRRRLLERSAEEGSIVAAFHVGEAGRVSKTSQGYAWSPL